MWRPLNLFFLLGSTICSWLNENWWKVWRPELVLYLEEVDHVSRWWWVQRSTEPSSASFQMSSSSSCCFFLLLSLGSFLVWLHLLHAKSVSNKALTFVTKTAEPQKSSGWKWPQNIIWPSLSWEGEPGWNYLSLCPITQIRGLKISSRVVLLHP